MAARAADGAQAALAHARRRGGGRQKCGADLRGDTPASAKTESGSTPPPLGRGARDAPSWLRLGCVACRDLPQSATSRVASLHVFCVRERHWTLTRAASPTTLPA
jgi:hypothetical protein